MNPENYFNKIEGNSLSDTIKRFKKLINSTDKIFYPAWLFIKNEPFEERLQEIIKYIGNELGIEPASTIEFGVISSRRNIENNLLDLDFIHQIKEDRSDKILLVIHGFEKKFSI